MFLIPLRILSESKPSFLSNSIHCSHSGKEEKGWGLLAEPHGRSVSWWSVGLPVVSRASVSSRYGVASPRSLEIGILFLGAFLEIASWRQL